jgi:hypothetical protein
MQQIPLPVEKQFGQAVIAGTVKAGCPGKKETGAKHPSS